MKHVVLSKALLTAVLLLPAAARADVYGFGCITNNSPTNCITGQAQLSVEVTDGGAGKALFTFRNAGPLNSSITDVYFDDGTLLGIASITNSAGVNFSQGASPGDLPGGNAYGFNVTAGFSADSNPPVQPNGVNPGEELKILFNLINGKTYADTITALNGGVDLRIGIHVQGFSGGGSESFINGVPTTVPEPSSVLLLSTLVAGTAWCIRRKLAA